MAKQDDEFMILCDTIYYKKKEFAEVWTYVTMIISIIITVYLFLTFCLYLTTYMFCLEGSVIVFCNLNTMWHGFCNIL